MKFKPQILNNLFSEDDIKKLKELVNLDFEKKSWSDKVNSREVKKYPELTEYFSKKLESVARKVFNDQTLKSTYSVYLKYDKPTSQLGMHKDNNACTYTIDYCLSAITPWGVVVGNEEHIFLPGQGLAFMGGHDLHGRNPMPNPEGNKVEVIMFHFCPEDHWYFTEGPEYVYVLKDSDTLPEGDSYHLSPEYKKQKTKQKLEN